MKGIWIPVELMEIDISWTKRILIAEISQLEMLDKGCIASNAHFADKLSLTKQAVSKALNELEKDGYITIDNAQTKRNFGRKIGINFGKSGINFGKSGIHESGESKEKNTVSNTKEDNNSAPRWDYSAVIASWNELDLPNISLISSAREKALNARYKDLITVRQDLKEMPKHEAMQQLFSYIRESDFLMGRSTDFKISFDWLMKPNNFVKVMEGNYND